MIVGLVNPTASRAHSDLAHVLAAASPKLRLWQTDRAGDLADLVELVRSQSPELIVVGGGDGTVCHLLTALSHAGLLASAPPLLALPAGRVNTIASALVGRTQPAELAQRILLAWTRGVRRIRRVPVQALQVAGVRRLVGFTASVGAAARLHADYRAEPWQGMAGMALVLGRLALQQLPSHRFTPLPSPCVLEPEPLTLPQVTAGILSPLPEFLGFARPFPDVEGISQHGLWTALTSWGPLGLQAALPAIVRGHLRGPHLQFGESVRLAWRNGERPDWVVLDGEEVDLPAGAEVELAVVERVRMVVWRELPVEEGLRLK
jgi:diacylglycerol kinase family enzyme